MANRQHAARWILLAGAFGAALPIALMFAGEPLSLVIPAAGIALSGVATAIAALVLGRRSAAWAVGATTVVVIASIAMFFATLDASLTSMNSDQPAPAWNGPLGIAGLILAPVSAAMLVGCWLWLMFAPTRANTPTSTSAS
ncbi:MAG TPA: hypothetical protein VFU07_06710 [Candidatus Lumbricidophila sp.]|nr:hypothetical protein [Candidatus Lumbricidophila sp.]